jgi:hypothetical protein
MDIAHDLLPVDTIALRDAFWHVVWGLQDHLFTRPLLRPDNEALLRRIMTIVVGTDVIADIIDQLRCDGPNYHTTGYDTTHRIANLFFRQHAMAGNIRTFVRDPETGTILRLDPLGWHINESQPVPIGLFSNYVHPSLPEASGPDGTLIRGALRPVFLRAEFFFWVDITFPGLTSIKPWLFSYRPFPFPDFVGFHDHVPESTSPEHSQSSAPGAPPLVHENATKGSKHQRSGRRRGRPPGSGSYEKDDAPLVSKMDQLIKAGSSVEDAADQFAPEAKGGGSIDSRSDRLRKRYYQKCRVEDK